MACLLVDMLVLELKTISVVKAASDGIVLEYVQKQLVPQACGMTHECATDAASLAIRMDEDRPNFVADKRNKTGHNTVGLEYPRFCLWQPDRPDVFTLCCHKFVRQEGCRDQAGGSPYFDNRLAV